MTDSVGPFPRAPQTCVVQNPYSEYPRDSCFPGLAMERVFFLTFRPWGEIKKRMSYPPSLLASRELKHFERLGSLPSGGLPIFSLGNLYLSFLLHTALPGRLLANRFSSGSPSRLSYFFCSQRTNVPSPFFCPRMVDKLSRRLLAENLMEHPFSVPFPF